MLTRKERILALRKETEIQEKYVNVDLWMGFGDTLKNYRGYNLQRVQDAMYDLLGKALKTHTTEITIIIVDGDGCVYNRSMSELRFMTIERICCEIEIERIQEIESSWMS